MNRTELHGLPIDGRCYRRDVSLIDLQREAIIGKDGEVENLKVVSAPKELQQSALDAVRQWTYRPFLLNGAPVEVKTTIEITYS